MRVLGEGVAIEACIEDLSAIVRQPTRAGRHSPHARNALVPRVCGVSAPVSVRFRFRLYALRGSHSPSGYPSTVKPGTVAENTSARPGGPGRLGRTSAKLRIISCSSTTQARATRQPTAHTPTVCSRPLTARREPCYTVMQGLACNHTQVWVSSLWSYRRGSLAASTYSCRASEGSCSRTASAADSAGAWPPGRTARVGRGSTGCRPTRRPARCACPD